MTTDDRSVVLRTVRSLKHFDFFEVSRLIYWDFDFFMPKALTSMYVAVAVAVFSVFNTILIQNITKTAESQHLRLLFTDSTHSNTEGQRLRGCSGWQ